MQQSGRMIEGHRRGPLGSIAEDAGLAAVGAIVATGVPTGVGR